MSGIRQRFLAASSAGAALTSSALHRHGVPRTPSTWPVSAEVRDRLSIRWPAAYEWAPAGKWVDGLRSALAAQVRVSTVDIEQPYEGMVVLEVKLDDETYQVGIDYFDKDRLLDAVLRQCQLVFKMQYLADGYGLGQVVPGGYVPGRPYLYRLLPGLRHLRHRARPRYEVYGRFGAGYAADTRRAAIDALQSQHEFRYEGSLRVLPYASYLREAALSRICIDLPGNGDMCHRLVDYLALGCCVVRPSLRTRLHVPLEDRLNVRFVDDVESDLVSACAGLLSEPVEAAEMGAAALRYFDAYLRVDQLAGYYVDRMVAILGRGEG
ncbi:MAG: hypothetical protein ACRDNK_06185 [Solirubrobacteraceae bacterium]